MNAEQERLLKELEEWKRQRAAEIFQLERTLKLYEPQSAIIIGKLRELMTEADKHNLNFEQMLTVAEWEHEDEKGN